SHTVKNLAVADDLRVPDHVMVKVLVDLKNAGDCPDTGKNTVLLGENRSRSPLLRHDAGARSRIAGRAIFQQRVLQDCADSPGMPIHKSTSPGSSQLRLSGGRRDVLGLKLIFDITGEA